MVSTAKVTFEITAGQTFKKMMIDKTYLTLKNCVLVKFLQGRIL